MASSRDWKWLIAGVLIGFAPMGDALLLLLHHHHHGGGPIIITANMCVTKKQLPCPVYMIHQRSCALFSGFVGNRHVSASSNTSRTLAPTNRPATKKWLDLSLTLHNRGKKFKRHFIWSGLAILLLTLLVQPKQAIGASQNVASSVQLPHPLTIRHLSFASALVAVLGGVGLFRMGLKDLAQQLLVACARCTLQLQLLGGLILQWILPPSSQPWWIVTAWIVGVGIIGAQEAYGRLEYSYPALRKHLTLSFLASGLSVLGFALVVRLFGPLQPWYDPRRLVPVAGMLFGNCLSAVTLGATSLTRASATQRDQVELWLSRGATYKEAMFPLIRDSVTTALTPTINALSITGIVHLPGMMTGQILAGQSPRQAAIYQTIIWFLIASVSATTIQLLVAFITDSLVDKGNHRLLNNVFPVMEQGSNNETKREQSHKRKNSTVNKPLKRITAVPRCPSSVIANNDVSSKEINPVIFRVRRLCVDRAGVEVSLNLHRGDRVGITGASGRGKSQILRTLIGLEDIQSAARNSVTPTTTTSSRSSSSFSSSMNNVHEEVLELHGVGISEMSLPQWRTQVCLVSNDRPTIAGSPQDMFHRLQTFRQHQFLSTSQQQQQRGQQQRRRRQKNKVSKNDHTTTNDGSMLLPANGGTAGEKWWLSQDVLQRPWSSLSSGEAQRANLMLALSSSSRNNSNSNNNNDSNSNNNNNNSNNNEPQVLLLDEIGSALDDATTLQVEKTLQELNIPVIMVTHDRAQLDRFCTHHLDLEEEEE